MKWKKTTKKHITALTDQADRRDLIRSTAEWFAFVGVVILGAAILLNTVFGIEGVELNGKQVYVFVAANDGLERGDVIIAGDLCAAVKACSGELLPLTVDNNAACRCIWYQNQLYTGGDMAALLDSENHIPEEYLLVQNISKTEKDTYELVRTDSVTGKVQFVVYPYTYLGKTVYDVVKE
ncbi:MAG: hypothetical protein II711_03270 [Clostridia bacterium]|nr:hypothetical protein [Clostridia bacterium]